MFKMNSKEKQAETIITNNFKHRLWLLEQRKRRFSYQSALGYKEVLASFVGKLDGRCGKSM